MNLRLQEMLGLYLSSVIEDLLQSPWTECERGYTKFIGSVGVIAAVPGRPHEWYPMIRKEFKKRWYCCEHGIDWWFQPRREIRNGLVHYGAHVTITKETKQVLDKQNFLDFLSA